MTAPKPLSTSQEAAFDDLYERGWTDGLPVIPPTPERVEAMVAASGHTASHSFGFIGPRRGKATVEKVAVNAVMAGCLPDYMPILCAAVSAVADPNFQLDRIGPWTAPYAPMIVVNGSIAQKLALSGDYDLFASGARANATIGRALRLVMLNIGGARPGEVSKSSHGSPGRQGICFAENEAASPWESYAEEHESRSKGTGQNAVTVFAVTGTVPIFYRVIKTNPEDLINTIAACMKYVEGYATAYHQDGGLPVLLLCPIHAKIFASHGWDKNRVREELFKRVDFKPVYGAESRLNAPTCLTGGVADERPARLPILVAGGVAGYHSTFLPTIVGVPPVTRAL